MRNEICVVRTGYNARSALLAIVTSLGVIPTAPGREGLLGPLRSDPW